MRWTILLVRVHGIFDTECEVMEAALAQDGLAQYAVYQESEPDVEGGCPRTFALAVT